MASITIEVGASSVIFNNTARCVPLISRGIENIRKNDQGPICRRKITYRLSGFVEGIDHESVITEYNNIFSVLSDSNALLTYNDGSSNILNQVPVRIGSMEEPESWKQHFGDYNIELWYFTDVSEETSVNKMAVSWSGTSPVTTAYSFEKTPTWSKVRANNNGVCDTILTMSGAEIQANTTARLTGCLYASDSSTLRTKMELLESSFRGAGILTYNGFVQSMFANKVEFSETNPVNYAEFTIDLKYLLTGVQEFSISRSITRPHNNVRVTERFYCGDRRIEQLGASGQTITYTASIKADSIANARSLLSSELTSYIIAGGNEMSGGVEDEDPVNCRVRVRVPIFYSTPVVSAL